MSHSTKFYTSSKRTDLRPKKSLSQNFLIDDDVAYRIIESLDLSPEECVVELGAGRGALTRLLFKETPRVVAIEMDRRFCNELREKFGRFEQFQLIEKDMLKFPLEQVYRECGEERFKVVGNLPYHITGPILFKLIDEREYSHFAVLMMQLEVAERLAADPGGKQYGIPSVITQMYGDPEILFHVPPEAFRPRPKVQSAVVKISWRAEPSVSVSNEKLYFQIVKRCFSQRRKMIRNTLTGLLDIHKENLPVIESESSVALSRRPETLSLEEFARLTTAVENTQKNNRSRIDPKNMR